MTPLPALREAVALGLLDRRQQNALLDEVEALEHGIADVLNAAMGDHNMSIVDGVQLLADTLAAERIEVAHLREAFVTMEQAANQRETERDGWIESARQFSRNEDYYRGLLDQIGVTFGTPAYTSDDGSLQDAVLRAKVPDLVAGLRADLAAARAVLDRGETLGGYSTASRVDIQVDRAAWLAWQALAAKEPA